MRGYEFSEEQNQRIDVIRTILFHVSLLMFAVGVILLYLGHQLAGIAVWVTAAAGILFQILGVVYFRTLIGFKRVVKTERDDVSHMMAAVDNLGTTFATGTVAVLLLSVLVFVFIVALLI
jgi:uncharacterized membrane protein